MPPVALTALEQQARASGLDLLGLIDVERFDASQPPESRCGRVMADAGTGIVLASSRPGAIAASAIADLERALRAAGVRARAVPRHRCTVSYACLGEAAGMGIVSPVIHRLLHPRFGPWVTVHGVILVGGRPFGPVADASIAATFHPCCSCARPCVAACPAGVHDGKGRSDEVRCHEHRHAGGCRDACAVVRSCPLGAEQSIDRDGEAARHAAEAQRLAARHGQGLVQQFVRAIARLLC